jgi:hypothetical protein
MEARWIQQCASLEELAEATTTRIPSHLEQYDRIVVLRALPVPGTNREARYELVEIPLSLLARVRDLSLADFRPRTKQGGSRASVSVDRRAAYSVVLDGSDGKITISGLLASLCTMHASWVIPTLAPDDDDQGDQNDDEGEPTLFSEC